MAFTEGVGALAYVTQCLFVSEPFYLRLKKENKCLRHFLLDQVSKYLNKENHLSGPGPEAEASGRDQLSPALHYIGLSLSPNPFVDNDKGNVGSLCSTWHQEMNAYSQTGSCTVQWLLTACRACRFTATCAETPAWRMIHHGWNFQTITWARSGSHRYTCYYECRWLKAIQSWSDCHLFTTFN